jgi:hypothetical protein
MTDGHRCSLVNGLRLKITARACMKYGRLIQVTAFFAAFEAIPLSSSAAAVR